MRSGRVRKSYSQKSFLIKKKGNFHFSHSASEMAMKSPRVQPLSSVTYAAPPSDRLTLCVEVEVPRVVPHTLPILKLSAVKVPMKF